MVAESPLAIRTMVTIRSALRTARGALEASETPDLDVQVLLAHLLNVERAFLFAHSDHVLDDQEWRAFRSAVTRRAAGEPIAYIIGRKGFYDLDLIVTPAVLIPRPETELLLEEALRLTEGTPALTVADIGTGSGALAVTFARQRPASSVYATEISRDALAIASENARLNSADVTFFCGSFAGPLIEGGIKVDLLMANLPYIAGDELAQLAVSRFEPRIALDGGSDGLDCIRALLAQILAVCRSGAYVLLEIGADQAEAVSALVQDRLGAKAQVLQDYAGLDRIARFQV